MFESIEISFIPWVEYVTDKNGESKPYYYNKDTKETSWRVPDDFKLWKESLIDNCLKLFNWRKYSNDKGRFYYYDKSTKKTQWDPPVFLRDFEIFLRLKTQRQVSQVSRRSSQDNEVGSNIINTNETNINDTDEDESDMEDQESDEEDEYNQELERDEVIQKYNNDQIQEQFKSDEKLEIANLETAQNREKEMEHLKSILMKRDSILEPNVIINTKRLRQLNNESPLDTINRLSKSYSGFPSMVNIVKEWLIFTKMLNTSSISTETSKDDIINIYNSKSVDVDDTIRNEIAKLIKSKFNRKLADELILRVSDIPKWLLNLMDDAILRKMLIQLYDQHSDSTLLAFALRQISKKGFHREISQYIREYDYLDVFNDMLSYLLSQVCCTSSTIDFQVLVEELKKNCSNNEFLFLYTCDLLSYIEKQLSCTNKSSSQSYYRIRRLRQEIEYFVLFKKIEAASSSFVPSSSIQNSNKFIFSLIGLQSITNLQAILANDIIMTRCISEIIQSNKITSNQLTEIYNYYIGIDDIKLESPPSSMMILHHVQVINIFINSFLCLTNVKLSSDNEQKKLVCLLSLISSYDEVSNTIHMELYQSLKLKLMDMKSICQEILEMGSEVLRFTGPERLVNELMNDAIISSILLRWILFYSQSSTQHIASASYVTILPVFYQIIVSSISKHPSQRPLAFEVLDHVISKISSTQLGADEYDIRTSGQQLLLNSIDSLKNNGYECLLFLISNGYCIIPMEFLISNTPNLDIDNIKWIIKQLVSFISGKVSNRFQECLIKYFSIDIINRELLRNNNRVLLEEFRINISSFIENQKLVTFIDNMLLNMK